MDPTPSNDQIHELREKFLSKLEEDGITGTFHEKDIERARNNDGWVGRFLSHHDLDMVAALQMMLDTCKWRKEFGANEIKQSSVPIHLFEKGILYTHNRDKDGKAMLLFRVKGHHKGVENMEDLQKLFIYWLERLEREEQNDCVTVMFDMQGTGLKNMDMDYISYQIHIFKSYYPSFLNYILVFEMPWILNAAFKIIKTWLPAKSIQKIKFLSKANIKEYVDVDQQLVVWGGTDDFEYIFKPEEEATTQLPNGHIEDGKKKVHFAEESPSQEVMTIVETSPITGHNESVQKMIVPSSGPLLKLHPSEELLFRKDAGDNTGTLTVSNINSRPVAYKIKTTSPEKYRVRPSMGILSVGGAISVTVSIQRGYQASGLVRDKFLVMGVAVEKDTLTNNEIAEIWKNKNKDSSIEQHRLKCAMAADISETDSNAPCINPAGVEEQLQKICDKMEKFQNCLTQVQLDLSRAQRKQLIIIILIIILALLMSLMGLCFYVEVFTINKYTVTEASRSCFS